MRALTAGKDSGFNKWLSSKTSSALLDSWNEMLLGSLSSPEALAACARRHFGVYSLPADMRGWLLGLCVLAESLPLSFVLSDAQTAGFPLIYINKKFTDVTGYTKEDCYGRNCRFLQGPATNPEHGKMLLDTLRNGQDSQIMMVNYRKTGEVFENLLTMAYIRDCHGRRRYCVGLQLDLTGLEGDDGPWGQAELNSEAGRRLIAETTKKYTMLIKLLPQTLPVPKPEEAKHNRETPPVTSTTAWECSQLRQLADTLGVNMPRTEGANWISTFYTLLDQATVAVTVCDMSVPGLPLDYCNPAFSTLTGYPVDEVIGTNCRFLQSDKTEPLALYNLITAIRTYTRVTVKISNAKKDGTHFVNDLSTHPIFDSDGKCRFMVGISADHAQSHQHHERLAVLREALPKEPVEPSLFPDPPPRFVDLEALEQWREFQKANAKLIRLLWATEPDGALRQLLCMHPVMAKQATESMASFFAHANRPEDAALLAMLIEQQRGGSWQPLAGRVALPPS